QAARVDVAREDESLVLHHCCESKGFPAAATTGVHHMLARCRTGGERDELRAFVLHVEEAFLAGLETEHVVMAFEQQGPGRKRTGLRRDALGRELLPQLLAS